MLAGLLALLFGAVCVRAAGAPLRQQRRMWPLRAVGWVACVLAVWLALGAAGVWAPWWPVAGLGVIGVLLDAGSRRWVLCAGADLVAVALAGLLSIPPLAYGRLAIAAVAAGAAGAAIDWTMARTPRAVRVGLGVVPLLVLFAGIVVRPGDLAALAGAWGKRLPQLGIAITWDGRKIPLSTGAVAFLERPGTRGPRPGALFFHAAGPEGVRQGSACVLRRALLHAGFVVLSVDHPGFGESPVPSGTQVEAWNPLPTAVAALRTLRATEGVAGIVLVGHSLGAMDVFRLLALETDLQGAVVAGTGIADDSLREDYWYSRFHSWRRLRRKLPRKLWRQIQKRYYTPAALIGRIAQEHSPILFVILGGEPAATQRVRQAAFAAISLPKTAWELTDSNHFFNVMEESGVLVGDTGVARAMAGRLRRFAEEIGWAPGRP